jgi:hypothetical protein
MGSPCPHGLSQGHPSRAPAESVTQPVGCASSVVEGQKALRGCHGSCVAESCAVAVVGVLLQVLLPLLVRICGMNLPRRQSRRRQSCRSSKKKRHG